MSGIPPAWRLSAPDRQAVFTRTILPAELEPHLGHHHKADGKQPLAVLIVGQTGAGKTRLAPALAAALAARGRAPAHLIADTYKMYHPHYAACLAAAPDRASALASLDARVWLTMACAYAVAERLDVLVESACRHPDDFCELADVFYAGGYNVRVAVLAVPEALSRLGILVRYYRNAPEAQSRGLPLRLTPKAVHDDSYRGLEYAARFLDEAPAAGGVIVVRRNNMLVYKNERAEGGGWRGDAGALRALEMERVRGLSGDEGSTAREDIDELRKLGDPRVDAEIREIEGLIEKLGVGHDEQLPALEPLHATEFIPEEMQ
ncbi:zeta toxin-domain-containing protein [Lasiosphaeria hispida]|uniref:Zeta toxin-domain-containing protein n=1 Tax=Lasiosphaeria hispida TaxID=260671 RepID=A0AAJ0HMB7_9PEZI|nr:zeta toxin-domain-containing protein [Lasiosphaeria hispida]